MYETKSPEKAGGSSNTTHHNKNISPVNVSANLQTSTRNSSNRKGGKKSPCPQTVRKNNKNTPCPDSVACGSFTNRNTGIYNKTNDKSNNRRGRSNSLCFSEVSSHHELNRSLESIIQSLSPDYEETSSLSNKRGEYL